MKKPYFSVIIPILNEGNFIPSLLDDLSKQTFRTFETIVVDTHSDDDSLAKVKKYIKRLPKLTILESAKRNSRIQRNLGALKAHGEYLVLFEADVRIDRTFLSQVYGQIQKTHAHCYTTWLDTNGSRLLDQILARVGNLAITGAKYIGKPFAGGFNTIVKRRVYVLLKGYREDLAISDDHDFATRLYNAGYTFKILRSPKIIYSFRRFYVEGYIHLLWVYMLASLYFLFKGPLTTSKYTYPMNGSMYDSNL